MMDAEIFRKNHEGRDLELCLLEAELPSKTDWLDNRVTWTFPDGSRIQIVCGAVEVLAKVDIVAVGGDNGGDEMGYSKGKPVLRYAGGDWLDASDGTPFVDGDGTHYLVCKQTWMQETE